MTSASIVPLIGIVRYFASSTLILAVAYHNVAIL